MAHESLGVIKRGGYYDAIAIANQQTLALVRPNVPSWVAPQPGPSIRPNQHPRGHAFSTAGGQQQPAVR